ncbi:MAG: elongation factor 1-beta [Methanosarcinales archaeon]|jgi:elongation factor 1-beta|nr:elongation factor 1-beta [Methanosarcinales archaeon]
MSGVAATIKVMPADAETDLNVLKEAIKAAMPAGGKINGEIVEQPIAFGLKALIVTVIVQDDEGGVEAIEDALGQIPEAEGISVTNLDRI